MLKMKKGIFAVYKPKGPTSHDVVNKIRRLTGERRVGHAGTLDPLAKGVLVVAVGREFTKQLAEVVKKEKEYVAVIRFGFNSTTDDAEGDKTPIQITKKPDIAAIEKAARKFKGNILQMPPAFSALKIKGTPAYKLARRGQELKLKKRRVEIKEIEILKYKWPDLKLRIVTGPGVYIRSLARDIGAKLKTGGYLFALERTRVGKFTKEKAMRLPSTKPSTALSSTLHR